MFEQIGTCFQVYKDYTAEGGNWDRFWYESRDIRKHIILFIYNQLSLGVEQGTQWIQELFADPDLDPHFKSCRNKQ